MGEAWREVSSAARRLRRAPAFTATAVLTLALGIGADALVVGVVDGVVFRPLPYPDADRLVAVWPDGLTLGELQGIRAGSRTLGEIGAWRDGVGVNLEQAGDPLRVSATLASPELLELLGIRPALGSLFPRAASDPGLDDVVLLDHAFWRDRFGADPAVVGRTVALDGRDHRVVGVLPAGLELPWATAQVVLPLVIDRGQPGPLWGSGGLSAAARLAPGAAPADARAELVRLSESIRLENPVWTPAEGYRAEATVLPLREALVGDVRTPLLVLLAAVVVVLLVVCANVANLVLSRGLARRGELAVRVALGAGRGRLAREQILETLLLAGAGTGLGVLLARAGLAALHPLLPADLPRLAAVGVDGRVLLVSASVAALVGVVTGLVGTLRAADGRPAEALRASRGGSGPERRRLSRALVMAQVAASVVLVTSAGLLVRSLQALRAVDPGFRPEGLVTARVDLSPAAYPDAEALRTFHASLARELAGLGEAASIALAGTVPFGPTGEVRATFMDGVTEDPNALPMLRHYRVSPGWFATMGVPLLEGRDFGEADGSDAELVAIVDRTAAERFWPGESPVGRIVRYPWRGAPAMRVVGVVGAVSHGSLAEPPEPTYYVPFAQNPSARVTIVARTAAPPAAALAALAAVVGRLDERVPVSGASPYSRLLGASLAEARLLALMLLLFAGAALLLGGVGVYGVAAYSVRERVRDFGVRMALGARAREIRGEVLVDVAWLALPGLLAGLVLAPAAALLLGGLLYGVAALDPVTLVAVPVVLALTVAAAVAAPALRATRVDPARVLREG